MQSRLDLASLTAFSGLGARGAIITQKPTTPIGAFSISLLTIRFSGITIRASSLPEKDAPALEVCHV